MRETYTIHAEQARGKTSPAGEVTAVDGKSQTFRIDAGQGYPSSYGCIGAVDSYTFQEIDGDHEIVAIF